MAYPSSDDVDLIEKRWQRKKWLANAAGNPFIAIGTFWCLALGLLLFLAPHVNAFNIRFGLFAIIAGTLLLDIGLWKLIKSYPPAKKVSTWLAVGSLVEGAVMLLEEAGRQLNIFIILVAALAFWASLFIFCQFFLNECKRKNWSDVIMPWQESVWLILTFKGGYFLLAAAVAVINLFRSEPLTLWGNGFFTVLIIWGIHFSIFYVMASGLYGVMQKTGEDMALKRVVYAKNLLDPHKFLIPLFLLGLMPLGLMLPIEIHHWRTPDFYTYIKSLPSPKRSGYYSNEFDIVKTKMGIGRMKPFTVWDKDKELEIDREKKLYPLDTCLQLLIKHGDDVLGQCAFTWNMNYDEEKQELIDRDKNVQFYCHENFSLRTDIMVNAEVTVTPIDKVSKSGKAYQQKMYEIPVKIKFELINGQTSEYSRLCEVKGLQLPQASPARLTDKAKIDKNMLAGINKKHNDLIDKSKVNIFKKWLPAFWQFHNPPPRHEGWLLKGSWHGKIFLKQPMLIEERKEKGCTFYDREILIAGYQRRPLTVTCNYPEYSYSVELRIMDKTSMTSGEGSYRLSNKKSWNGKIW